MRLVSVFPLVLEDSPAPEQCSLGRFRVQPIPEFAETFPTYPPIDSQFYKKFVSVDGFPITSSAIPSDEALKETAKWVCLMLLAARPSVKASMIAYHGKMTVIGSYPKELTTQVPEFSYLTPPEYWNERARGLGATPFRPTGACAEENVLCASEDRYRGECIMVHEFAHSMTLLSGNSTFLDKLQTTFENSVTKKKLWANTYSATNAQEYFADAVQAWLGCQSYQFPEDGVDGPINTIDRIQSYDPDLFILLQEFFPRNFTLKYTCPDPKQASNNHEINATSTFPLRARRVGLPALGDVLPNSYPIHDII
jgi:hypothetical protein